MAEMKFRWLITLFQHQQQALNSHRGYDPGTLDLFEWGEIFSRF